MQTITTQFKGPTNTKGARVFCKSWIKSASFPWDHSLNSEQNHKQAAQLLVDKINAERLKKGFELSWSIIAEGSLPDGKGNAYIIDLVSVNS